MKAAQNICIGTLCKGIFFAGDNQVDNDPFISARQDELASDFLFHQKKHWLDDVKAYKQTKKLNINIFGAFHVAETF